MKKIALLGISLITIILTGCDTSHNFMDVDNPNAKYDLKNIIGSGNFPNINTDSLSGTRNDVKLYTERYYTGKVEEYIDKAKEGLSGTVQDLKGYYNNGVDELNKVVSDKVNGVISDELNKFKIK